MACIPDLKTEQLKEEVERQPRVSVRIDYCDACYSDAPKKGVTVSMSTRHEHVCGCCLLKMIRALVLPASLVADGSTR